jgi:hypothetical protein
MGDNDNANEITKSFFESRLSNRSLVLVGGGVHSHASREEGGMTSVIQTAVASGKKRERKRVGGNGMFGSLSKRKRKKTIQTNRCKSTALDLQDATDQCDAKETAVRISSQSKENINKVIVSLQEMWLDYISRLLQHHIKPDASISAHGTNTKSNKLVLRQPITLHMRRQISLLLLEAEHVGMAATIMECPSRRNLVHYRCLVINETVNTWSVALFKSVKKSKRQYKKQSNSTDNENEDDDKPQLEVVMIPKRGTELEINVPLHYSSDRSIQQNQAAFVSVRLKT